jgi:hypothetical protein
MSDEYKPAKKAPKKPSNSQKRVTAKAAMTVGTPRAWQVSVPVVPRIPDVALRRGSALFFRLGVLTTILTLVAGTAAWFSGTAAPFGGGADQAPPAVLAAYAAAPLPPHARESLKQEHRLAALALDQSQQTIFPLSEDARALAASVGALASGIDVRTSQRIDAVTAQARMKDDLEVKPSVIAEPVLLGDPALREFTPPVNPPTGAKSRTAEVSETDQPATTGALPVAVNHRRPVLRRQAIKGWRVHYAEADYALVASKNVSYRVRAGHVLPGPGIVRAIEKRRDQWVVLTSKGLISEAP